jgi:2-C-methyl-D-erythritol 2,4-cyclodiphosphate synthase
MIGFGYDSHRFQPEGKLLLGGIEISSQFGVVAHSDGDVLLHSLIDALLGAAGLGDIGSHFPDTEEKFRNADSIELLKQTLSLLKKYRIVNIDITVILEKPKLAAYKERIKDNIAAVCNLDNRRVNIKAKSNEKMGFVGRGEGIVCYCICQIEEI